MSKKKIASADQLKSLIAGLTKPRATTWLRTGIHALDLLIGGGLPEGRIIEIAGTEAAGKTSIGLMAIAAAQRAGGAGLFYDSEHALDFAFAEKLGVDTSLMVYERDVKKVEQVRDLMVSHVGQLRAIAPKIPMVLVVDSIAALSAEKEWKTDKESGEEVVNDNDQPGRRAKALSDLFRFYTSFIDQHNVVFIAVNQLRDKIGSMFGEKQDSPGGHALKYHASVRIRLNRGLKHESGGQVEYIDGHLNVKKNKVAPPFRKAVLKFNMNRGFDTFAGLKDVLEEAKRIKINRGTILVGEEQFKEEAIPEMVAKHPELLEPWL